MLPLLAALGFVAAWQMRRLASAAAPPSHPRVQPDAEFAAEPPQSGFRVFRKAPYLRDLAALVLLGTLSAALIDYVFKAQAVATFGRGDTLLRFFAIYYAAASVVTFVLQTSLSRTALDRVGLPVTTASPSIALVVGGIGSLIAPGFESLIAARGGESVFRGSLFRSAYKCSTRRLPVDEKRAAKSTIERRVRPARRRPRRRGDPAAAGCGAGGAADRDHRRGDGVLGDGGGRRLARWWRLHPDARKESR